MSPYLINIWRKIIVGEEKSWVLFHHGTCVVFSRPAVDLRLSAIDLIEQWGPVGTDNPVSDYRVVKLVRHDGWVVACRHPDILTYIDPEDLPEEEQTETRIGLLGRGRRYADSAEKEIIHIEDNRPVRTSS